jgi:RNA polymerase sigma-70 factor (ECF subfamily)
MSASNRHLMTSDLERSTDDSLLAATAAGQIDAFAALFRRRRGDVYRFALHMTGLPALAEDVTQDVFLIVMRDAGRYQAGRSTAIAWLCGIARNCARRRLERDRLLQPLDDEGAEGEDGMPAVHPDPLGDLTRAERIETLRRAVLSLPIRYREVVVLCDLQELTYAEAGDALGCAIGTVRSRLHRGRTLLAAKLTASDDVRGTETRKPALTPRGSRCCA